jgi:hypothetical protein
MNYTLFISHDNIGTLRLVFNNYLLAICVAMVFMAIAQPHRCARAAQEEADKIPSHLLTIEEACWAEIIACAILFGALMHLFARMYRGKPVADLFHQRAALTSL